MPPNRCSVRRRNRPDAVPGHGPDSAMGTGTAWIAEGTCMASVSVRYVEQQVQAGTMPIACST